ncbi:MAG TPA: hypothetical protein VEJ63_00515, partial [Planctomycetota bacterium]|nr:hypothetical protein [Planctomycetota bacterium]
LESVGVVMFTALGVATSFPKEGEQTIAVWTKRDTNGFNKDGDAKRPSLKKYRQRTFPATGE